MGKRLEPGQGYAGRPAGVVPVNLSLDKDAVALLRLHAPSPKTHGRFLSRLIFEYAERQRIVQRVTGALEAVDATREGG